MLNQSASAAGSAARLRLLLGFCAASVLLISRTNAIGVNFGQVSNSLPPDEVTLKLVQSTTINKLKIYSADPGVLTTFAGSGIDIVIGADNDQVQPMASTAGYALTWAQTNIAAYPNTSIVGVALGNEVLSYQPQLTPFLLPALQNLQAALVSLGLDRTVKLSSPSSLGIVANSFPPSYGEFLYYNGVMSPLLEFFAQTGSPFMVNVYPYFAYAAAPENISLDYVLFNPGAVPVYDSGSGLNYTNMFDAQVDAVYAAMSKLGYNNVTLSVTETGWPSAGDPDEAGANVVNAQLFNANLVKHIASGIGTPAKPGVTVDTYIFALYNEDMKPGPTSERNFGLYNTDGTPVYNSGLIASTQWYGPPGVVYPPPGAVPPVAYWPPPAPVLASPPPPYGVAQPPPVEYPPPPVSASPPPPYVVAQPPPVAYPSPPVSDSPPPPYCPPPPVSASPPPPDGAAQPPPQGYPPPVVATPPVPALSPPAPPVVVGTPPTAGWSPPPPPVVGDSPPPPPLVIASPPPPVVGDSPPPVVGTSPPPLVTAPPPGFDPTAPAPGTSPIVPTAPSPGVAPGPGGVGTWCIAKSDADAGQLQIALDWACSTGGANCSVLQVGGSCYTPNTLVAHASYAFDSYYQLNNRNAWDCFFSDTANITAVNPSFAGCPFP